MKEINLLGIRKRAILCRTSGIGEPTFTVMCPLTAKQEKELDMYENTTINERRITRKSIYIYGEVNLDNQSDLDVIKKLNISNADGNNVYSNFDYEKGIVTYEDKVTLKLTWNVLDWFKYNYCLIGKPARIVIYECNKSSL